ncbi:MAG: glycosyltransferase [Oscillospiraceae bacterium]|nr:glycosyltransferase [Oscillospiraceae bacterium]
MALGVAFGWNYKKGLGVFCALPKMLGDDYQVVLVGTDEKVESELPNDVISIHSTQNMEQLAELYSTADVFVNPTREDNYPTVNMEALACGTPVITFNTGGCSEIIDDSNGIVMQQDDLDALIDGIVTICEKNGRADSLKKRYNL